MNRQVLLRRTVLLRRLDADGMDVCFLDSFSDGYAISGTAVFHADGGPTKLDYRVSCDKDWRSRSTKVRGWIGTDVRSWEVVQSSKGSWTVNGQRTALLDGLMDVDLGFTPATNTNVLNRLRLQIGAAVETTAVWLDPDDWSFKPLTQTYRRLSDTAYAYTSPVHDYTAELVVDHAGLIQSYPGLWRAVSTTQATAS
jgi:uncharacterized protein